MAIDGPAGAGKSTVARLLAERLGIRYLDTGAMYRALTWLALARGADLEDGRALAELAEAHPVTFDEASVHVAGEDVSGPIRSAEVDRAVSAVSRHPAVRAIMRARQRTLAEAGAAVIEGRDIGSVVCPDAELKVYLVADTAVRVRRRGAERPELAPDALADDLRLRDERDADQMRPAPDAETIDTTGLSVEEVVDLIEGLAQARVRA